MDWQGQKLAEQLMQYLLLGSAFVAFLSGYITSSFSTMLYIYLAGVLVTSVVAVPDWPFFRRHPLHWLEPMYAEMPSSRQVKWKQQPASKKGLKSQGCLAGVGSTMRAVVQRVMSARIEVEGKIVSKIGPGLLVLVGLLDADTDSDSEFICRKILNMRLFQNNTTGKPWDQNVMQKNYEVLLVSQFTLYGVLKGNKPDFHIAMPPQLAKPLYESLVQRVAKAYRPEAVKDGVFGAMMQVHLVNDGPVTMSFDSCNSPKADGNVTNGALKMGLTPKSVRDPQNIKPQAKLVMSTSDLFVASPLVSRRLGGHTTQSPTVFLKTTGQSFCSFSKSLLSL